MEDGGSRLAIPVKSSAKLIMRRRKEPDGSSGPARSATALQADDSPYLFNARMLHKVGRGIPLSAIAPCATADAEPRIVFWTFFCSFVKVFFP